MNFFRKVLQFDKVPKIVHYRRLSRLLGALVGFVIGIAYGTALERSLKNVFAYNNGTIFIIFVILGILGLFFGLIVGPILTVDAFVWFRSNLKKSQPSELIGEALGILIGMIVAVLIVFLFELVFGFLGLIIGFMIGISFVYIAVETGKSRALDIVSLLVRVQSIHTEQIENKKLIANNNSEENAFVSEKIEHEKETFSHEKECLLIDTSTIIDGRILDIAKSGFLPNIIVIPKFVIDELQRVADSKENHRRERGRFGLEILQTLKHTPNVQIEFIEDDYPDVTEVDTKLVKLGKEKNMPLMTMDYNLMKVANIENVKILNLNDLVNALRPTVIPGEEITLKIYKKGENLKQGVGFLNDGTMVIVEDAMPYQGEMVRASVFNVIQKSSGRLVFARFVGLESSSSGH